MASMLIMDDDPTILSLISAVLEERGHKVLVAPDGKAGLKLFNEADIDLVITDIIMPEQEGIATIGQIRRQGATTPILAISGSLTVGGVGDYLRFARAFGANATLAKPLDLDRLLEIVDGLLDTSS